MLCEIMLGTLILLNVVEICLFTGCCNDDYEELTEEMRARIYS